MASLHASCVLGVVAAVVAVQFAFQTWLAPEGCGPDSHVAGGDARLRGARRTGLGGGIGCARWRDRVRSRHSLADQAGEAVEEPSH
jgi:hypothetical protein